MLNVIYKTIHMHALISFDVSRFYAIQEANVIEVWTCLHIFDTAQNTMKHQIGKSFSFLYVKT